MHFDYLILKTKSLTKKIYSYDTGKSKQPDR